MTRSTLTTLRRAWRALRTITGDDAYERYLAHQEQAHPQERPLDSRSFYLREQERRFSAGPTRCC